MPGTGVFTRIAELTGKNKLPDDTLYDRLLNHPDIVGRIDRGQTSGAAVVRQETVDKLFEAEDKMKRRVIKKNDLYYTYEPRSVHVTNRVPYISKPTG